MKNYVILNVLKVLNWHREDVVFDTLQNMKWNVIDAWMWLLCSEWNNLNKNELCVGVKEEGANSGSQQKAQERGKFATYKFIQQH